MEIGHGLIELLEVIVPPPDHSLKKKSVLCYSVIHYCMQYIIVSVKRFN